ncbi:hypothetical protein ANN_03535 [Periplaneta americana]|uniref:Uncharacterized protein n=1 Tax=Periplaneta americana TaxID=6978 RepID=A0ABQ8TZ47_PERAM|nr:hypothetical protein ANN_03535 [Periplaneta americana]
MGECRNAYRVLVGRPEGKRPLGRPRRRWEDNIKTDLREVGYDGRDWINLAQDRDQWRAYVRAGMNLRVPWKPVLRKIFGAKRDEVTGEWIKLHKAELHAMYSSPDIIRNINSRRLRWVGYVARMTESRNAYGVLVGKQEGKRPLRGRECRVVTGYTDYHVWLDYEIVMKDIQGLMYATSDREEKNNATCVSERSQEAADFLDRPPWNVVQRRWMASAMAPEADLLGGGVSPRTDRGALGEFAEAGMPWLGHVLWRDEGSLLRKAFDYSPRCKRPLGRPRLRCQGQVYDNLCTVGGRQEDAENRDEWRYIMNEAKNHLGFEMP